MKRAYVSLITGGDIYLPGIETLGRSLRATGTRVPMLALATSDVPAAATATLAAQGWEVRAVEPIASPAHRDDVLFERFDSTYTKLRAFGLADVEKVVFLDADTLVLRTIDELFERPDFAAAPDFFMPDRFNSGVMVLEPSVARLDAMTSALATSSTYDGGDQGFLNTFLGDWWALPVDHRLPARYNMHHFVFQFLSAHPSLRQQFLSEIKVIHFTLQKPWRSPTVTGGSRLWWHAYMEGHPERDRRWRRDLHNLEDWTFESVVRLLGGT